MNKETVMALLAEINDENSGRDLVSAGNVREVGIHEDSISVDIRLGYPLANQGAELADIIKTRLENDPGINMAEITIKPGRYLFLGDNRDNSHDGRKFGTVRLQELEGPAGLLYWSWDWNGGWLELLNPLTWWDNLVHRTRWGRVGRFENCFPSDGEPPGRSTRRS